MKRYSIFALFFMLLGACQSRSYVDCEPGEDTFCTHHGMVLSSHVAGVAVVDTIESCSPRSCGRYGADPSATVYRITAHWDKQCLGDPQDTIIIYTNYPETRQMVIVGERHVANYMLKRLGVNFCSEHEVDDVAYTAGGLAHVPLSPPLHILDEANNFELANSVGQITTLDLAAFLTECAGVAEFQAREPNDSHPPFVSPDWGCADAGNVEDGGSTG
jgi:hypothetical protein